jgi:hypothetical protein
VQPGLESGGVVGGDVVRLCLDWIVCEAVGDSVSAALLLRLFAAGRGDECGGFAIAVVGGSSGGWLSLRSDVMMALYFLMWSVVMGVVSCSPFTGRVVHSVGSTQVS